MIAVHLSFNLKIILCHCAFSSRVLSVFFCTITLTSIETGGAFSLSLNWNFCFFSIDGRDMQMTKQQFNKIWNMGFSGEHFYCINFSFLAGVNLYFMWFSCAIILLLPTILICAFFGNNVAFHMQMKVRRRKVTKTARLATHSWKETKKQRSNFGTSHLTNIHSTHI